MTSTVPRLLAISDAAARRDVGRGGGFADWLGELARAGVDAVQVREKGLCDRALYELVREAVRASPRPALVLVNGRLDVALAAGADGVHLPSGGVPVAALRRRFGPRVVIGRSTHHPDEVAAALEEGADYVTFGPVFSTPSKMRYGPPPGPSGLRAAAALGMPVVALGGVSPERLDEVVRAGAHGAAGIRAFHDPDVLGRWAAARRAAWPAGRGRED